MVRISRLLNRLGDSWAWGFVGFFKLLSLAIICFFALGLPLFFVYEVFCTSFFYLFLSFFSGSPAFNGLFIFVLSLCCAVTVLALLTVFFYRRRKRGSDERAGSKKSAREKLLPALGLALLWAFLLSFVPNACLALLSRPDQGTQIFLTTGGPRSLATLSPIGSQKEVSLTPGETLRLTNSTRNPLVVCVKTDLSCDANSGLSLLPGQTTAIVMDQVGTYLMNCTPVLCNLEISVSFPPVENPGDDTSGLFQSPERSQILLE